MPPMTSPGFKAHASASPPQHLTRLLVVPACTRIEEDDAAVQAFVDASAGVVPVGIGLARGEVPLSSQEK